MCNTKTRGKYRISFKKKIFFYWSALSSILKYKYIIMALFLLYSCVSSTFFYFLVPMGFVVPALLLGTASTVVNTVCVRGTTDARTKPSVTSSMTTKSHAVAKLDFRGISAKKVLNATTRHYPLLHLHSLQLKQKILKKCMNYHRFAIHCSSFAATSIKSPRFDGRGYLEWSLPSHRSFSEVTSFSLDLRTRRSSGLVLWIGEVS